jgi:uncharacterized protein (UPF0335 family)
LDVCVIRKEKLYEFEIYRKPTDTMRVIPVTSNHSQQHKMAAFNHMVHRMMTLPLTKEAIEKETKHIEEVARLNGYKTDIIHKLIKKKKKQLFNRGFSTLTPEKPKRTRRLKTKCRNHNVEIVYTSRPNQLMSRLQSTKDPVSTPEKCGVYKIDCPECEKAYIGQTKRTLAIRFEDHEREAKKVIEKGFRGHVSSKVAKHMIETGHKITIKDSKILKNVKNPRKLDVAESMEIYKHPAEKLLNTDKGNNQSWLFKYIKNKN